jgi:hypothetical protein
MVAMKTGQLELFRLLAKVLILMGRIKSSSEASSLMVNSRFCGSPFLLF